MKSLIEKIEHEIENVAINVGEKFGGGCMFGFAYEPEMPALLKEEIKKEEKNARV